MVFRQAELREQLPAAFGRSVAVLERETPTLRLVLRPHTGCAQARPTDAALASLRQTYRERERVSGSRTRITLVRDALPPEFTYV